MPRGWVGALKLGARKVTSCGVRAFVYAGFFVLECAGVTAGAMRTVTGAVCISIIAGLTPLRGGRLTTYWDTAECLLSHP